MQLILKKFFNYRLCFRILVVLALVLSLWIFPIPSVCAQERANAPKDPQKETSGGLSPLSFFQKVVSRADGDRCPMYPSCSHYASAAFKKHSVLTAWILTCDRLLRCGHDELHIAPKIYIKGEPHAYDPLEANTFWWKKP